MVLGHRNRSPTTVFQNFRHQICWRISIISHARDINGDEKYLTLSLRASGAVHFTGSFVTSDFDNISLIRPKSEILAILSSDISTICAARSLR